MRSFWALPAVARLVAATPQAFSVQNDILAYPQYEIVFSESYMPAEEARSRLALQKARDAGDERKATDIVTRAFDGDNSSSKDSYEQMRVNETDYVCRIPYVAPPVYTNDTATPESEQEQQQERDRAHNHGWELLSGMKGNCIYYPAGWWTYSFCFDKEVKQFHRLAPGGPVPIYPPIEDPHVHSFVLGKYDEASRSPPKGLDEEQKQVGTESSSGKELSSQLQTRGETNYLIQRLGGGTLCDLTNRERAITVQFHCDPHLPEHIHMIKETATCAYLMVVHTPLLCNDVAFRPPEIDKPNYITCQEVVEKHHVKEWTAKKTAKAEKLLFGQQPATADKSKRPIIIGGIEVGGKKIVGGTPETTIETSNIIKPPQQQGMGGRFVATLAKSDGKYRSVMSEEEIEKLGLKGKPGDIENLIHKMESKVKERGKNIPWRLDVYETQGGYEFRGLWDEDGTGFDGEDEAAAATTDKQAEGEQKPSKGDHRQEQEGSQEEYKDEL